MADYYSENDLTYYSDTVALDTGFYLELFFRRLPPGSRILDVGCGSGRDLLAMRQNGYDPIGFERSPGLALLAREHSGCDVIEGDFETFDFSTLTVDALLMGGSLVHIPHDRLAPVLQRIWRALGPRHLARQGGRPEKGLAYISLKEGQGTLEAKDGRTFFLWSVKALEQTFENCGLLVVDRMRSPAADGQGSVWLGYVVRADEG